jgi:hypothetical protein
MQAKPDREVVTIYAPIAGSPRPLLAAASKLTTGLEPFERSFARPHASVASGLEKNNHELTTCLQRAPGKTPSPNRCVFPRQLEKTIANLPPVSIANLVRGPWSQLRVI